MPLVTVIFNFEFCLNARMKDFYHLFQKICCPTVRFLKFTVPWLEQLVAGGTAREEEFNDDNDSNNDIIFAKPFTPN